MKQPLVILGLMNTIPFNYRCRTCANKGMAQDNTPACVKFKIKINPEEDFCAWHDNENIQGCHICGSTDNLIIDNIDNENYLFCKGHYNAIHSCQGCVNNNVCGFASDHSEPQVVMKTIRQGMMTMQTQIKNPNLIQKHCSKCQCSYADGTDFACLKDLPNHLSCSNWQLQKALLQQYSQ